MFSLGDFERYYRRPMMTPFNSEGVPALIPPWVFRSLGRRIPERLVWQG